MHGWEGGRGSSERKRRKIRRKIEEGKIVSGRIKEIRNTIKEEEG